MGFFNFLMGPFSSAIESSKDKFKAAGLEGLESVAKFLDDLIIPATIILAVLGAGWIIWLGVKLAKAEDAKAAQEAKSALIRVAVAIIVTLALIWILAFICSKLPDWIVGSPIGKTEEEGGGSGFIQGILQFTQFLR